LFINFAKFYESQDDLEKANKVFFEGTQIHFRSIDQITDIWCEWAEMHLRCNNYDDAIYILKTACTTQAKKYRDSNDQLRKIPSASNSIKTWSFYVDLEEQLGNFENVRVRRRI